MKFLFSFAPLLSLYFLFDASKEKSKSKAGLTVASAVAVLAAGWSLGLSAAGFFYALIFVVAGFFPVPLRRRILEATQEFKASEHVLKEEVEQRRLEYEKWFEIKQSVMQEMERILKRYTFAKSLVSYMEEKPILLELSSVFGSQKGIVGLSCFTRDAEGKMWLPSFSTGWITQDEWRKVFASVEPNFEGPFEERLPLNLPFSGPSGKKLILAGAPIRWSGSVQGFLAFLFEDRLSDGFLDEIAVYSQLLSLGLHKTHLYRMVVDRSRRDGLTNLYLRSVFLERLQEEISFSKRYGTSFSLLILDLDHFKSVNDSYGHPVGDKVLKAIADCLRTVLHPGITVARYGGEEFAILVGLAPSQEVMKLAEQIRKAVEHLVLSFLDDSGMKKVRIGKRKGELKMTVSIGVAHYLPTAPSSEELIRRADTALYWAKEAGRNRVKEWKEQD